MAANPKDLPGLQGVPFKLDGRDLEARPGETILQAAKRAGVHVPHLCYKEGYRPDGNCRACVVEIKGERALAPSCVRKPTPGMEVHSTNERARASQALVLELLLSDIPGQGESPYSPRSELDHWARVLEVGKPRFPQRKQPRADLSNPAIAVNLDACIQCTRCVRACREEQVNDVIGYAFRGSHAEIVFDLGDPMGESTCVSCGECVQACPTGALMPARGMGAVVPDKKVESVCPFCGVGCLLTFNVKNNRIVYVDGRDGPANESRLCVKGRYGFDYVHNPRRLTKPLIRREDAPKSPALISKDEVHKYFREATWEEALDLAAAGLRRIRDRDGAGALAGFGSAKGSNEEAYLFQKLVRTGFGTNNVDHCTRLCHASSVAALLEGIGSAAVSNQVADGVEADVIVVIGARPAVNHPVAATYMKNAAKQGKTLVVIDPKGSDQGLARHAKHFLQIKPASDIALLNAMMYTIVSEGLTNDEFIARHTEGFEQLKQRVLHYPPEMMSPVCGIPAQTIREVARAYAKAERAIIFWGMGVSQHTHGTDNARGLIALALMTGQIGRPGTGLHPLRGQNNVQGASDVGLIPMVYPDYQRVDNPQARARFEELWGTSLDPSPGLTVVEIMSAVHEGRVRGMYVMGENPAMSDPNLNHAREALAHLEHLVVQDIFFTETASYADVVLPASAWPEKDGTVTNTDRRVQMGRRAIELPGEARQDLWIIQELARRMGLNWDYAGPREVFEEIRKATPSMAGITWERLESEDSLTYPLEKEGDPGEPVIFTDGFPTASGKARFVPADYSQPAELPDAEYPFVLMTGRVLEHWHTGSMTRTATVLDALEPGPSVFMHPQDIAALGVRPGDMVVAQTRRGSITAPARADTELQRGSLFIPFAYFEAAANLLTNPALDPFGKIPEFKFCAVKVTPAATVTPTVTGKG